MAYARALFAGDYSAASRYVDPASRSAFFALTAGLGPRSVSSRHLAAGSATVTGATAVVVLTGTICSSASMTSLASSPASPSTCVTNTDPHAASPIFRIDLAHESDGRWLVVYRAPAPDGDEATGAASSVTSPVPATSS